MSTGPLLRRTGVDAEGRSWLIRPALDEDVAGLVRLRNAVTAEGDLVAAVPGERSILEESLALDSLRHGGGLAIVVEAGGELAGQLQVARRQGSYEGHAGDLSIALGAEHRGRGLGTALMGCALDWARAVRLRKICLAVFPGNERAIALYTHAGFEVEGRQRAQIHAGGADRDLLLMGLLLSTV